MTTIRQNLVVGNTESFDLNIQYNDSDDNPVNLTGHSVEIIINDSDSWSASVNATGGIAVHIDDEDVFTLPTGKNRYVLVHEDLTGNRHWLCYGTLTVID